MDSLKTQYQPQVSDEPQAPPHRYRIGIFGNGDVACQMMRHILYERPDLDLVALIPEGKDKHWEQSFEFAVEQFKFDLEFRTDPYLIGHGNVNKYADQLQKLDLDLLMGCRSGALVKQGVLDAARIGVTNLHYGDLPRYGGCHTIQHAILNGEAHVGVAFHFMTPNFDDGPIISRRRVPIFTGPMAPFHNIYIHGEHVLSVHGRDAYQLYTAAQAVGVDIMKNDLNLALAGECFSQRGEPLYFTQDTIDFKRDSVLHITPQTTRGDVIRHFLAFNFPPIQTPQFVGPMPTWHKS